MQGEQPKQDVGGGGSDQLAGLEARLDEMSRLVAEMQAARSSGVRVRVGITVVLLAIIAGFLFHIYDHFKKYPVNELQAEMQAQLVNADAEAMQELMAMGRGLVPVYRDEIKDEFTRSWPEIREGLEAEGKRLLKEIPGAAEEKVRKRLETIAKREEKRMMEAFPELADDETRAIVMDNLEKALQGAVLTVFEERLDNAQSKLLDVQAKTIELIPLDERDQFMSRMQAVWDQLLQYELGEEGFLPK